MEKLHPDTYTTRGRPREPSRRDGLTLFALIFLSCALLVFSRLDLEPVRWLRWRLIGATSPVLVLAAGPVSKLRQAGRRALAAVDALSEIERLRADNQRLRGWEWRAAELERKLAQVSVLARTADEIGLEFATGRVIADARGPFASSVLVDLGARHGVKIGFAAVNGDGLIGHVVDVGENAARILMLNDANSRIPVLAGPGHVRAILRGDGAEGPRLTDLSGQGYDGSSVAVAGGVGLRMGDDVLTSGDEGLLPRGLKVGVVRLADDGPRVVLAARLQGLDFVSLLFFDPPQLAPHLSPDLGKERAGLDDIDDRRSRAMVEPTSGRRKPGSGPGSAGWPTR